MEPCQNWFSFRCVPKFPLWCSTISHAHRTHDAIITSLLRQNGVVTLFSRNSDVIIASCIRWVDWFISLHIGHPFLSRVSVSPSHLAPHVFLTVLILDNCDGKCASEMLQNFTYPYLKRLDHAACKLQNIAKKSSFYWTEVHRPHSEEKTYCAVCFGAPYEIFDSFFFMLRTKCDGNFPWPAPRIESTDINLVVCTYYALCWPFSWYQNWGGLTFGFIISTWS